MKRALIFILLFSFVIHLCVPSRAYFTGAICRVECDDKKIALTFDDGPHPVYTREILDILSEYGVRATFFIVGKNAEEYPDLIIDEIADGHELGSHTYSHKFMKGLSDNEITNELTENEEVISTICDYRFKSIRPPGGIYSDCLERAAEEFSYNVVLWSVDTRDWTRPDPERIVLAVESNVKDGDIILMHDYVSGGASSTPAALRRIIPDLLERGFEFVTVSELLASSQV